MKKEYLDFNLLDLEVKKADDDVPDGFFKGMAAVFNNVDSGSDVILPGAFAKTLKRGGRNGNGVSLLWMHEQNKPIGVPLKLEEQNKGLYMEGLIAVETTLGRDAYILMKMGAVRGISIGFTSIVDEIDNKLKVRKLKEIELWEASIVTFPMNKRAVIGAVKSTVEGARTVRQMEEALRDAGLSCTVSKYLAGLCQKGLRDADPERDNAMVEALRGVNSGLAQLMEGKQ